MQVSQEFSVAGYLKCIAQLLKTHSVGRLTLKGFSIDSKANAEYLFILGMSSDVTKLEFVSCQFEKCKGISLDNVDTSESKLESIKFEDCKWEEQDTQKLASTLIPLQSQLCISNTRL